jgi:hypothetical protein
MVRSAGSRGIWVVEAQTVEISARKPVTMATGERHELSAE